MAPSVSIGETLRRRREERALTPEQAALQSKVPLRLVQMLESDDYQLLPDPLYLVGLLRRYGSFLGLDVAALDAEYQRAMYQPPPSLPPPAPRVASTIPWKQIRWTVAAILVTIPLVVIALSLASKRSAERAAPARAVDQTTERPVSAGAGSGDMKAQARDDGTRAQAPPLTAKPEPTATPAVTAPDAAIPLRKDAAPSGGSIGHTLVVHAQESTWLAVRVDQKEPREVLLQPGQTARFEAKTGFQVVVGNAGGVKLSLDGTPLPPLGRSGEVVRNLVLPPARRESPASADTLAGPAR